MIQKYILSFDCGTTAVKAVLINFEGKVICNAKAEYSLIQLHPGWAEQNPEELWKAICKTSQNVITKASIKPDQIIGLIYAAPWKNIIPIDANGNVLRNSLIWMDARASAQAERLNQAAGFFVGTGQEYWPRLMWVKENEPEIWENAKSVFFNVTSNHDRRHLVHAVMESICYTHRRYLEHYEKAAGKKLHSIRVVGGGAVSDLWMQMLSDVLQITVEVPESPRYTGAMGTYYCAMVGLGYIKDYNAVYDTVKIQRVFKPRNENAEIYDKLYKIYLELHPALHNLYGSINGVY